MCFQGCSNGRLYGLYLFSLCVKHDESFSTCFLGGGGVVVADNLGLEAFDRSHTHKCHTQI